MIGLPTLFADGRILASTRAREVQLWAPLHVGSIRGLAVYPEIDRRATRLTLTRAPALRELTIRYDSLTREDCALLTRGAVFSRNACWLDLQNANGMGEDPSIPQEAARARLACAARFTTFAGAESLCGARSPARRFLEGDGDRAIVWRLLRLLGIQP